MKFHCLSSIPLFLAAASANQDRSAFRRLEKGGKATKNMKSSGMKGSKSGKGLKGSTTRPIFGRFSTDLTSSCYAKVNETLADGTYAACSRYWGPSTCGGTTSFLTNTAGNTPANGNLGLNTCLGMGDSPTCYNLGEENGDVLVRVSSAWDWSEYAPPENTKAGECYTDPQDSEDPNKFQTCARILTNSSIPLVSHAYGEPPTPDGTTETTGFCYNLTALPDAGPAAIITPPITTITSTVSITLDSGDGETYVGNIKEGGQLCEMWGYTNGYGNNFDSQYIPFEITIGKDDYEGYITGVFDHRLLLPPQGGISQAPGFSIWKV